jgi:hypothetical protein
MPSARPPTLNEAVDDLLSRQTQDSGRLNSLARYCIAAFEARGLPGLQGGAAGEAGIRGIARDKDWDLAYLFAGKPRLLISLKSILRNLAGTIPNRLDDLLGEAANVQQFSPELVTGYVVIIDEAANSVRRGGGTWIDFLETALHKIAIRRAPLWNQGLIEGVWTIRIDSRRAAGNRVLDLPLASAQGQEFVERLVTELRLREPAIP